MARKPAIVQHGRKHPPENETKRERFERIGRQRMQRALVAIRLIGNLSVKASYEYEANDVAKIEEVLRIATDKATARFRTREATDVDQFFFPKEVETSKH